MLKQGFEKWYVGRFNIALSVGDYVSSYHPLHFQFSVLRFQGIKREGEECESKDLWRPRLIKRNRKCFPHLDRERTRFQASLDFKVPRPRTNIIFTLALKSQKINETFQYVFQVF